MCANEQNQVWNVRAISKATGRPTTLMYQSAIEKRSIEGGHNPNYSFLSAELMPFTMGNLVGAISQEKSLD